MTDDIDKLEPTVYSRRLRVESPHPSPAYVDRPLERFYAIYSSIYVHSMVCMSVAATRTTISIL
jgi:hypothetical protein